MNRLKFTFAILFICLICSACHAAQREVTLVIEKDIIEDDLAGFNVYMSNESGVGYAKIPNDTNPSSPFTLDYLPSIPEFSVDVTLQVPVGVNITYYFVATALDTSLNESGYSPEAYRSYYIEPPTTSVSPTTISPTTIPIDTEPPLPPDDLRIIGLKLKIVFKQKQV